jgi:type VI protein secretion system component Hcp
MTLSDVTISSIMSVMSPRAQNDFTHLEQVSLRYSKIEWLYSRYNESTGALIDTTQERWDVAKNKD